MDGIRQNKQIGEKIMVKIMSIIKYIFLIAIIILTIMISAEFLPGLIERGKEVTSYMREYGTMQGVVNSIEYGDPYTTVTFQNTMGEILTYKIENKYAGSLSIIQDSYEYKREIKIYHYYSNDIYDVQYVIE